MRNLDHYNINIDKDFLSRIPEVIVGLLCNEMKILVFSRYLWPHVKARTRWPVQLQSEFAGTGIAQHDRSIRIMV